MTRRLHMLGVKVQGGFSSEAQVFARLLAHGEFAASVIYHAWPGGGHGLTAFQAESGARVLPMDLALRPGGSNRTRAARAAALLRFRSTFGRIRKAGAKLRPDLVYSSQQLWDCAVASYLAEKLQVPHMIHLHYRPGPWLQTGFSPDAGALRALLRLLRIADPMQRLRECAQVVAVSDFIRREAIASGVSADRVATIHNPVPPVERAPAAASVRAELGLPEKSALIGTIGRLDPDKGHEDTLDAFEQIAPELPNLALLLVGDGARRHAVEKRAADSRLRSRIRCTGFRADVPRLLGALSIFSHPSRLEPFGLSVAEASSAGLPVVAYDDGALPEVVRHGETGLLAPPGDRRSLANCLRDLATNPQSAAEMGRAGQSHVRRAFDPAAQGAKFAEAMAKCAASAPHSRVNCN